MKLLIFGSVLNAGTFNDWMSDDLRALGHEVVTLDPDEVAVQFSPELFRRFLLQRVAVERPHVVLTYPPYDYLRTQDADAMRELGAVVVGYAFDDAIFKDRYEDRGVFDEVCREYRRTYDLYLTTSRAMAEAAQARGHDHIRHVLWSIRTPAPLDGRPRDLPILMVGKAYARRAELVLKLKRSGLVPALFGPPDWNTYPEVADCYKGQLTAAGMVELHRRAQVTISPCDYGSVYIPMVKLRVLEGSEELRLPNVNRAVLEQLAHLAALFARQRQVG